MHLDVHIDEEPQLTWQPAVHVCAHSDVAWPHHVRQPPGHEVIVQLEPGSVQTWVQPPLPHVPVQVALASHQMVVPPLLAVQSQTARSPQVMLHPPGQSMLHCESASQSMRQPPAGQFTWQRAPVRHTHGESATQSIT
ncbi:MAG TPA: hypothetical protein VIL20_06440, partial [Sandaracinaceae bacterium]